ALKNEVYEASEIYYARTKDVDGLIKIDKKQDTLKQIIKRKDQSFINKSYSAINKQKIEIQKTNHIKSIVIIIVCLFLAACLLYFIRYRRKQKESIERFKLLLEQLDKKKTALNKNTLPIELPVEPDDENKNEKISSSVIIPLATEQKIIAKLNEFENLEMYTSNNISIAALATYCETNIKYLSYVIRNQ